MIEFEGIVPAMAKALDKRGYEDLTPVQKAVLDPKLANADALVSAQTGSGKTVAFGLALAPTLLEGADRFDRAAAPLALAVAPTRELALQVQRELEWLYEFTGATVASCVGGMDMRTERRTLERGAHIVVGTPGRLRDHITRNSLDMSAIKAVVLDEADEMLDLGFREDLEFILDEAPSDRRTLMFSATVPRTIANLAKSYQRDAVRISTAAEQKQHVDIEYRALTVAASDRENAIINVLRYYDAKNAIVFCSTRAAVNHLTARFNNRGFAVVALSGELSQNERSHALQAMRDGRARVCVATDVAARGIDLPNLELVVHADLPTNSDTLLHRSGRTGRAGRKGVSALIVTQNARRKAERLLQGASIRAEWARPPSADEILRRDDEKILADASLTDPLQDDEHAFVKELLERHSAEQVAAAYVRLCRAGRSAPEDLQEVSAADDRKKGPRDDFGSSVWFSLSVGRRQNAEPRWLIPTLCRSSNLTKRQIGAIKMMQEETYVEISADSAEAFLASLGKNRMLEDSIRVTRVDGTPDFSSDNRGGGGGKSYGDRKPRTGGFGEERDGARPKRPFKSEQGAPRDRDAASDKPAKRAWDKKPAGKPKFSKPAGGPGKPKRGPSKG